MPDENFTELAGDRVVLRRFRLDDVPAFVAYRTCAHIARFQSWDAPYSREEGERVIREMMREHPDTAGQWFQFAVALRPAGPLIGDCAAKPDAADPRQCEIGFTIASGYQGHGYATEAARLLVGYLFTGRGKHRSGLACAARVTCARAPGPRASGPTTCCMACCTMSGSPDDGDRA